MSTMNILAIDPGTHCGYALSPIESGTWDLSVKRNEGGGMRFVRLRNYLNNACENIDLVVFEESVNNMSALSARIFDGIIAIIAEHCEMHEIPYEGIHWATIKRHATGKGNANKDAMVGAARSKWPDIEIVDDNQADALWIWDWAQNEYGGR
jgi:Holliday junction resolvasome RuvABC endonuclease subunit